MISASTRGASPGDPFAPPWRIGPFFGQEEAFDVLLQQTAAPYARGWDETQGCWTGDGPDVNRSITADRIYGKPVVNTENGYEYLPGQPTERNQVHHTDKVRRTAWRIVCAGGYFARELKHSRRLMQGTGFCGCIKGETNHEARA